MVCEAVRKYWWNDNNDHSVEKLYTKQRQYRNLQYRDNLIKGVEKRDPYLFPEIWPKAVRVVRKRQKTHDLLFEVSPTEARAHITNAVYLEDNGVTVEGLNFWGSPVTPVCGDWAFAADRGATIRSHWDKIPDDTDVLITHGPPFGTLDKADILAPHLGCKDLTKAVIRIKPRLHVFGHVHGGYGRESGWNDMLLVNCAVLSEAYALTNQPTVVDLVR